MSLDRAVRGAALFVFAVVIATFTAAQDITLTAQSDGFSVTGEMVGFDGRYYRVRTEFGILTLDSEVVNCTGEGCVDAENFVPSLTFAGETTLSGNLLPSIVEAFSFDIGAIAERETNDGEIVYKLIDRNVGSTVAEFRFVLSTSSQGFIDLSARRADVVLSIREITDDEADALKRDGLGDLRRAGRSQIIGLDALVSEGNEGGRLTTETLATHGVTLLSPSADWVDVLQNGMGLSNEKLNATSVNAAEFYPISTRNFGRADPLVGVCGFSVLPTRANIKSEDYPLTVPLLLYLPQTRQPEILKEFLAFIRSDAAQLVVRRAGFVELTSEEIPVSVQGARFAASIPRAGKFVPLEDLQAMVDVIGSATRLSMTFRTASGANGLDAQSKSNIQQLAAEIRSGKFDGKTLVLAGFSDGQGEAAPNKDLSKSRADAVLLNLSRALGREQMERVSIEAHGFGEALPIGCDESGWGRRINRRVEVWLR